MANSYDIITDHILARLEEGTVPWRKPWNGEAGMPKNLVSKKDYRGINVFLLHCLGYESPYFVTFKQSKKLGGHVKKGEKGCPVVFWKQLDVRDENEEKTVRHIPMLRYYTVFNVSQTEGLDVPALDVPEREHSAIEAAEQIVQGMPKAPEIKHGHTGASYSPIGDVVRMPRPEVFETGEGYYSTLFHELTHSTGHTSRLDRKLDAESVAFGSADYSREELVAEMGSAFLSGQAGINTQLDQSAAYIEGWLKKLKSDRKLVVVAAAQAQKAADFVLGRWT